ncbi:hypothetical protein N7509_007060 [Penicillium cosmopolitanum]|uniref:C2H2-type domain-containing protein n=1 Tax=Penicillium cosmopolitanum TaxID=1131564 RepID=A0A9W9VYH7_9EURO|nr:uncharacterized protein N7509_007060 [Penicillium cosmopolitanum]KAJ5391570.1 hypothetical protein N7509_007060 [Penicillium cosmopolitanum]
MNWDVSNEQASRQPDYPLGGNLNLANGLRDTQPLTVSPEKAFEECIFSNISQPFDLLEDSRLDPTFTFSATSSLDSFGTDDINGSEQGLPIPNGGLSFSFLENTDWGSQEFLGINNAHPEGLLSLSPMDRWKNSPPETEPAHLTDIMSSITHCISSEEPVLQDTAEKLSVPRRRSQRPRPPTPSIAASESSASSSSASSARSFGSSNSGSFGRFYVGEPRRRRNRRLRKKSPTSQIRDKKPTQQRPFQCTFCTDTFKSKHDWTRHEKTLHLSLESWVCAPFGPTYRDEASNILRCVFCEIDAPSEEHIQFHRHMECQEKPSTLRTFYRKDHLLQHLRLFHGSQNAVTSIAKWKSEVTQINSRCGFCSETFTLWSDRNDHLAAHFRQGTQIKEWKGCRGLDPAVVLAVDNAMPPYLIGIESTGIYPFSASRREGTSREEEARVTHDTFQSAVITQPTPFEQLTEHLIRFVREQQHAASPITDESIQREARLFIYGDDDPWNQTAADSPDWLNFFKDGMGLGPACVMNVDAAHHPNPVFHLPWDINTQQLEAVDECNLNPVVSTGSWTPWSWQSPECLAEFRRFNRDTGSSLITPDNGACALPR